MKLSLFTAAPALLLASSTVFAQQAAPAAPAAAAPVAPAAAPAPVADAPATAAAPAPAPELPAPAAAPLPPPADMLPPPPPPPADSPLPTKLGISKEGWWQPGATLQFWAFGANQAGDTTTTLRIRRAELRVKGEIIPKFFAFNVMFDPARALDVNKSTIAVTPATKGDPSPGTVSVANQGSTVTILQDYFITLQSDYADVTLGQFKIPVSLEGYGSASKLLFPERAIVSRKFGDARDLGIKIDKKIGKNFYYQVAVFNGEGQNKLDTNAQKDLALRLEVYPIDGITIGAVGYASAHNRTTTATTKDRVEGDLKIDLADFVLQAEYIHGWDGPTNVARTESAGAYAALGYTIAKTVQPLVRIGAFDANVRKDLPGTKGEHGPTNTPLSAGINDEITSYELGLNYFLKGNDAKLMASWSHFVMKDETNRGEVILGAQAAF